MQRPRVTPPKGGEHEDVDGVVGLGVLGLVRGPDRGLVGYPRSRGRYIP